MNTVYHKIFSITQEDSDLTEVSWGYSYEFVKNDTSNPGKCYVLRNDFK